jgi:hypothetical protein
MCRKYFEHIHILHTLLWLFPLLLAPTPNRTCLTSLLSFFCSGTGVSPQGFTLKKQALYFLSHNFRALCFAYFWDGRLVSYLLGWTLITLLLISTLKYQRW